MNAHHLGSVSQLPWFARESQASTTRDQDLPLRLKNGEEKMDLSKDSHGTGPSWKKYFWKRTERSRLNKSESSFTRVDVRMKVSKLSHK
ncbi:hypothetical protein CDAR_505611 [Caerostris darwini]|uniref:Uncharacterized protein n=1 Tax=Caerostris darwini TaxID=1538125 RepID=A0AAV4PQK1_9ARAC|nr:hypothetical protein CDAR_505611 [Caerostris darwini]